MKVHVHTGPVRVSPGTKVRLSKDQLRRRAHLVSKVSGGVHVADQTLEFKRGEIVDLPDYKTVDQLPGYIAERVEAATAPTSTKSIAKTDGKDEEPSGSADDARSVADAGDGKPEDETGGAAASA